jgi:hypothetical protein
MNDEKSQVVPETSHQRASEGGVKSFRSAMFKSEFFVEVPSILALSAYQAAYALETKLNQVSGEATIRCFAI